MSEFQLGMNGKLYFGAEGAALGAMVELDNVRDVTTNLTAGEADVTTRANQGWRATDATLKECSVDFEMLWKAGDDGFEAIKNAFLNGTRICLAALTGARNASGSEGPHADFSITSFTRSEPLEEGITVSVSAKLANFIDWIEVA